jgi:hypothetical protein
MKVNSLLNRPVPREIAGQIVPEPMGPAVGIESLEPDQVGCLKQVPQQDLDYYVNQVTEAGYRHALLTGQDVCEIAYSPSLKSLASVVMLRERKLGLVEPPLSINQYLELARLMGQDEAFQSALAEVLKMSLRIAGIEEDNPQPIWTPPVICLNAPIETGQTAMQWADENAEAMGFDFDRGAVGPMSLEVTPRQQTREASEQLKARLTEANIAFGEHSTESQATTQRHERLGAFDATPARGRPPSSPTPRPSKPSSSLRRRYNPSKKAKESAPADHAAHGFTVPILQRDAKGSSALQLVPDGLNGVKVTHSLSSRYGYSGQAGAVQRFTSADSYPKHSKQKARIAVLRLLPAQARRKIGRCLAGIWARRFRRAAFQVGRGVVGLSWGRLGRVIEANRGLVHVRVPLLTTWTGTLASPSFSAVFHRL